ncbi:MAG: hypothetical protein AAF311_14185 [Pseudomonadota bacterium]
MGLRFRDIAVILLVAAFLLPALGYAAGALRGTDGVSASERRALAALPEFDGSLRAYTAAFDDHLEDNFGFRMWFIRTARNLRDNLGEDPPQVVFGKKGWLFLGNEGYRDEFEGQGLWNDARVEAWIASLKQANAALTVRGIPFAAYVGVDKARIYSEYLPDDWTPSGRRFRSRLHAHAGANDAGLIDAERYVLQAKDAGVKTFYQRDTHWTPDGTHALAMAVLDRLDPEGTRPRFDPAPPRLKTAPRLLDLEGMAGFTQTQEPAHPMIDIPAAHDGFHIIEASEDPASPRRGQFATWRIKGTRDAPEGTLVVVGDSFGDAVIEHLRPSYARIVRLHHGAHLFDVSLADVLAERPDAVLFATAERQAFQKERPFATMAAP